MSTHTSHDLDGLTPAEVADLARTAREVIARLETITQVCGLIVGLTLTVWLAAMRAGWPVAGAVALALAATAFIIGLLATVALIVLGPPPAIPPSSGNPPLPALDASSGPPSASARTSATNGEISRI